jgi:hypothetical protein
VQSKLPHNNSNVQRLARTYNSLCDNIQQLINDGKAPRGAQAPIKLQKEGLFKLDVDDEIWQDIDTGGEDVPVPAWLGNESVQHGIRALLEYDCCIEEEEHLLKELHTMHAWMQEEWFCITSCINISGMFFYKLHKEQTLTQNR